MNTISQFISKHGPQRSSSIARWLIETEGLSAEAARKRLSRVSAPVHKFPYRLLPKKEDFLYLHGQRKEERFWPLYHQAMRETHSVFGAALDGLIARRGTVRKSEFSVISGAPLRPLKGQLMADRVYDVLLGCDLVLTNHINEVPWVVLARPELFYTDFRGAEGRRIAEGALLEGLRQWVKNLGLASYNLVRIRGDNDPPMVGPFQFDLTGPSYLLPLQTTNRQPGFLVADAFVGTTIDEHHLAYFIRKVAMANIQMKGGGLLPLLVADAFTGRALTVGRSAGLLLATPKELFGVRAGRAISDLAEALANAAAFASSSPERLTTLIEDLSQIEGAAGNLRGILFELICAYLARQRAVSIDIGVRARHTDQRSADIDVLAVSPRGTECLSIECKGKGPGGIVELNEVEDWLQRLPIFQSHLRANPAFQESQLKFEIWTSGTFSNDAEALLVKERAARTKSPIDWLDGRKVLKLSQSMKEAAISNALRQHFISNPMVDVINTGREIRL